MNQLSKLTTVSIAIGLLANLAHLQAQTVAWGTSINPTPMSFTSNGSIDNLTWELGWFDPSFTPDGTNYESWVSNWNRVSSLTPEVDPMNPPNLVNFPVYRQDSGLWAVSVNTFDVGADAAGQQMYVFATNGYNRIGSPQGEVLLYTINAPLFPAAPDQETFQIARLPGETDDTAFTVVWGQVDRVVDGANGVVTGEGEFSLTLTDSLNFDWETQSFTWAVRDEAIFVAAPEILMGSPFARLPTLEQRVGERIWLHGVSEPATEGGRRPIDNGEDAPELLANPLLDAAWVRVIYDQVDGRAGPGRDFDSRYVGLQAGLDLHRSRSEQGVWVFAATAQLGTLDADAQDPNGHGSLDTEGFGFGATATWHGDDGAYIDLQSQYNFLTSDYSTRSDSNFASDEKVDVFALSIELGQRHVFRENEASVNAQRREGLPEPVAKEPKPGESWGFTPQAQLQWARIGSQSFTDGNGNNPVRYRAQDAVLGRIGIAVDYRVGDGQNDPMRKLYGIANLLHRFDDDRDVNISGQPFASDTEKTWGEIGLGGSIDWYNEAENRLFQIYGEFAVRRAAGSSGSYGTHATLGLRRAW